MDAYEEWTALSIAKWPRIFRLAAIAVQGSLDVAMATDLRNGDNRSIVIHLLVGRLISGTRAIIVLGRSGLLVEGTILFRSNMEALFRMAALVEQPEMLIGYMGEDFRTRRRGLKDAASLLQTIPEEEREISKADQDAALRDLDREENDFLRNHGLERNREISVWEWAKAGKQTDFFHGKYMLSSGSTHHSARNLESRMTIAPDGNSIESIHFAPDQHSPEELLRDSLLLLLRGIAVFAGFYGVTLPKIIEESKTEIDSMF